MSLFCKSYREEGHGLLRRISFELLADGSLHYPAGSRGCRSVDAGLWLGCVSKRGQELW